MHHTTMNSLCLTAILLAATLSGNVQGGDEKGVTYSVISENDFAGVRRSIDVRLNSKVSSQILHSIAWQIKKAESQNYERTFISYWLPGMKVGSGAWATTHFDPELEIQILGLTQEEEERMARESTSQSRGIVGVWLDDRPYVGATLTLYYKNRRLYLESRYKDGSGSTDEMTEQLYDFGKKLVEESGNPHGEYFVLDSKGDLHSGGKGGLFLKYKKLQ